MTTKQDYDRTWHILYRCTLEAADLLAIALQAKDPHCQYFDRERNLGLVTLTQGAYADGRSIVIVTELEIKTWRLPDGWAVGKYKIPVNWISHRDTWAGGDRSQTISQGHSGFLIIPETCTGEIIYEHTQNKEAKVGSVSGKKSFMGGWVDG